MRYQGSCHCQAITFEVEGDLDGAVSCNCSFCQRAGALLWFVPSTAVSVRAESGAMGAYTFNKHVIQHRFCKTCGIRPYSEGKAPDGTAMTAVNIRCLEGLDLSGVPVQNYDGQSA